jgi:hypothetical protein
VGSVSRYVPSSPIGTVSGKLTLLLTGQDNPSNQCIVGDVPEIWDGDESDHDGPYDGVEMGC